MIEYLILTSSGGGGHIAVAAAEQARLISEGIAPEKIAVIDIMGHLESPHAQTPWIPEVHLMYGYGPVIFSGKENVKRWNHAQKKGGLAAVRYLEYLINFQWLAEIIQAVDIEKNLTAFIKHNPCLKQIIDTQALSTANICHVVGKTNRTQQYQIKYTKVMTEFFTQKARHFLRPLRQVSAKDAPYLTVEVVNDLLVTAPDTQHDFCQQYGIDHIQFSKRTTKPLRAEFLRKNHIANNKTIYVQAHADDTIDGELTEVNFM